MKNYLIGWSDIGVAAIAAVYALVEVLSIEDLNALEAERAQQITIIFAISLFYIMVRLAWKGVQRYLKNQQLNNQ